jgi:hypothetical protein
MNILRILVDTCRRLADSRGEDADGWVEHAEKSAEMTHPSASIRILPQFQPVSVSRRMCLCIYKGCLPDRAGSGRNLVF